MFLNKKYGDKWQIVCLLLFLISNYQLSTTLYPVKTSYDVFHFKHFCGLVYA
ncbi:hypothetical protein BZG32_02500 [Enterococcus faecalis]|nr:hypothetical protein BZG32_02500 [Enterococcus faecalis]